MITFTNCSHGKNSLWVHSKKNSYVARQCVIVFEVQVLNIGDMDCLKCICYFIDCASENMQTKFYWNLVGVVNCWKFPLVILSFQQLCLSLRHNWWQVCSVSQGEIFSSVTLSLPRDQPAETQLAPPTMDIFLNSDPKQARYSDIIMVPIWYSDIPLYHQTKSKAGV